MKHSQQGIHERGWGVRHHKKVKGKRQTLLANTGMYDTFISRQLLNALKNA